MSHRLCYTRDTIKQEDIIMKGLSIGTIAVGGTVILLGAATLTLGVLSLIKQ